MADEEAEDVDLETLYNNGPLDMCAVFFYLLICIVVHAVVQEYVLDVSVAISDEEGDKVVIYI